MTEKQLSFSTTVHGVGLEVEVSVGPRDGGYATEEHLKYARALTERLIDVTVDYQPEDDTRDESLDAYAVLANTFQMLDLARDSEDTNAKQVKEYFYHAAGNLEVLAAWDPRFTMAYHLTRLGEAEAGYFDFGGVADLVDSIETWMPMRYAEPGYTQRRVIVDDRQTDEDFQATRIPDHTAVSIRMVSDDEVTEADYTTTGRTVLPVPMFPDGTLEPRVTVRSLLHDKTVVSRFTADRGAFHLLRSLGDAAETFTVERRGEFPVDFYTELAYAKQLCWVAGSERFRNDAIYRRKVIDGLYPSLIILSLFGPEYEMPKHLAKLADTLNEDMTSEAATRIVETINAWLPRDVKDYVPIGWTEEQDAQLPMPLIHGINALPGERFVAVFDEQTREDFEATGMPDKSLLIPFDLGPEVDPRVLEAGSAIQVFRTTI